MRFSVTRTERQRCPPFLDCPIQIAFLEKQHASVVMVVGMVRLQLFRGPHFGDGVIQQTFRGQHVTDASVNYSEG